MTLLGSREGGSACRTAHAHRALRPICATNTGLLLALALLATAPARADSLTEIFERANEAYFRGDYDQAASGYRRLLGLGVVDADVAFDLGTAEAKAGRFGPAIRAFEQALYLRPGDDGTRASLASARTALARRRAQAHGRGEADSNEPLVEALLGNFSTNLLVEATLALDVLFFAALLVFLWTRREGLRLAGGIASPLLAVALLLGSVGLTVRLGFWDEGEAAVVLSEHAVLREGPNPRAATRHTALEGQRAWVVDRDDAFFHVTVPGVGEGWMSQADVGLVRP